MKKNGFTLAEILVTLGIIGIISAITVPTLMSNFQRKTYEAGAKKAYNTVANAVATYMADEKVDDLQQAPFVGTISTSAGTAKDDYKPDELSAFVQKYFKVTRTCSSYGDCFSDKFNSLDRSKEAAWSSLTYGVKIVASTLGSPSSPKGGKRCVVGAQLADGMSMCFSAATGSATTGLDKTTTKIFNPSEVMIVDVDINGPAGPNVTGRDIFTMSVNSNGVVGAGTTGVKTLTADDKKTALPMDITYLLSKGWQMDY